MNRKTAMKVMQTLVIVGILTLATFPNSFAEGSKEQAQTAKLTASSNSSFENKPDYTVPLVTGDIVVVDEMPGGQKSFNLIPADSTKHGQSFRSFTTPNGTYVIPGDIKLDKFDIELFNIDYLIREGYHNMTKLPLIIQMKGSSSLDTESLRTLTTSVETRNLHTFLTQPMFAQQFSMSNIKDSVRVLSERPEVEKIWLDRKVRLSLGDSAPLIGAPTLWETGKNGTGVQIAILDTGIDDTHPGLDDFDDNPATADPKVIRQVDFTDDYSTMDYAGHGTHVAGIAAGTGAESPVEFKYARQFIPGEWINDGIAKEWRADDSCWAYTLPFDFPFFGNSYGTIYVSTNGLITFSGPDSSPGNSVGTLASRLAIAPAWSDWMTNQRMGDDIYVWLRDPTHVVVRWQAVVYYNRGTEANFEVILGSDGIIQFNYASNNGPVSATVGVSNGFDFVLAEEVTNLNYINTIVFKSTMLKAVGVAPGASLWNVKVLNRYGTGYLSWVISGIEYAAYGPDSIASTGDEADIISMSLGAPDGSGDDPLSVAVNSAVDAGIVVVAAAGNSGPQMFTVEAPGVAGKAITVGATTKTDEMIYWSSRGPTRDYRLKPDVVAPGVDITSSVPYSVYGVYYQAWSGTSMATPHVSGAAALILQANPEWTPIMVKSALMENAEVLANAHLWEQGAGRINVPKAANTTLLVTDPSLSFGKLQLGDAPTATLTISNLAEMPTTIDLSTYTVVEGFETGYVSVDPSVLTIPAHDTASVQITVGPLDDQAPEGLYEGWVNIAYYQGTIRIPYFFAAMSTLTVSVLDVDNATPISAGIALTTYPDMSFVNSLWLELGWGSWPSATMSVESGSYSLQAQSAWIMSETWPDDFSRMFMIQKKLNIPKMSDVYVSISLAEAFVNEIPTVDALGKNLVTHGYVQYFSGDPYYDPFVDTTMMRWSIGSSWFGFDINAPKLTFYSSEYDPADKLSEAFGYYASNDLLSEIYILNWKFWNLPLIPTVITLPRNDLAKYNCYYDMPETYPENGLNSMNAFWFTWELIGGSQGWAWDIHQVLSGINATYYLAPNTATYWGYYMPTYGGWYDRGFGPLQEWNLGRHYPYPQIPLEKGETGNLILGDFQFGPYVPALRVDVTPDADFSTVRLSGGIWQDFSWPHLPWWSGTEVSPYPVNRVPFYYLYIDDILVATGPLGRPDGTWYGGRWWNDIDEGWTVSGGRGRIRIEMPSLGTIANSTVYETEFDLGETAHILPPFSSLLIPQNFSPGEDIAIQLKALPSITDLTLEYSFDYGVTWKTAQKTAPGYLIPAETADTLSIRVSARDVYGEPLTYLSSPASICRDVDLTVPEQVSAHLGEQVEIHGSLTTLEGKGLMGLAVVLSGSVSMYAAPNWDGTFVFSVVIAEGTRYYTVSSPISGVYESSSDKVWIRIPASTFFDPKSLNLKSKGKWVTAYIQLPEGYNPAEINASTILLNGTIAAVLDPKYDFVTNSSEYLVDHNSDGILERMVKFNKAEVASWIHDDLGIQYGTVTLILTGKLLDQTPFEATDTVRLLFPGDADGDGNVDLNDFIIFAGCYCTSIENPCYVLGADFNEDGTIDFIDFIIFAGNYGKTAV